MWRSLILAAALIAFDAAAKKYEGAEFASTLKVGKNELTLNGVGLRKVRKFGFPIKVYVAGLYLPGKAASLEAVHQQSGPKVIVKEFLLRVDKENLANGFRDGYKKNCRQTCESTEPQLKELVSASQVDMLKGSRMKLEFHPDRVELQIDGRQKTVKTIQGADFSRNLLGVYLDDPPNPELKSGLLGATEQ